MDILFKPWVKATEQPAEQMTQNRTIRNHNESTKSRHVTSDIATSDMYAVPVPCLHSILRLET